MENKEVKEMLKDIYGKKRAQGHEIKTIHYDEQKLTVAQLVEKLKKVDEIESAGIHLSALVQGNAELAAKIKLAQAVIRRNQIDAFAQAVQYGVADDFLAQFKSWTDKSSLKVHIEMSEQYKRADTKGLDTKKLIDIIDKSIDADLLGQAQAEGFETLEAWRQNNAKMSYRRMGLRGHEMGDL